MKSFFQRKKRKQAAEHPDIRCRWTKLTFDSGGIRRGSGEAVLVGHRIYYYGSPPVGRRCCVFSLKDFGWQDLKAFNSFGRYNHVSTLIGDKIYIFGGQKSAFELLDDLHVIDLVMMRILRVEHASEVPGKRALMTAVWAPWHREIIYFGGVREIGIGSRSENVRNDVYALDVDFHLWRVVNTQGRLPPKRTHHSATTVGRMMYIYGGIGIRQDYLEDIHIADMRFKDVFLWSEVWLQGRVPIGRMNTAFDYLSGVFVLFGGYTEMASVGNDLDIYVLDKGEWQSSKDRNIAVLGEAPEVRSEIAVAQVNSIVYFTKSGVYRLELDT